MVEKDSCQRGAESSVKASPSFMLINLHHGVSVTLVGEVVLFHGPSNSQEIQGSCKSECCHSGKSPTKEEFDFGVFLVFSVEAGSEEVKDCKILKFIKAALRWLSEERLD